MTIILTLLVPAEYRRAAVRRLRRLRVGRARRREGGAGFVIPWLLAYCLCGKKP